MIAKDQRRWDGASAGSTEPGLVLAEKRREVTDVNTPDAPADGHDRTEPVDIQVEMQRSYIDYAMSVIVGRALPDVRMASSPCIPASSTRCTTAGTGPSAATPSAPASSAR